MLVSKEKVTFTKDVTVAREGSLCLGYHCGEEFIFIETNGKGVEDYIIEKYPKSEFSKKLLSGNDAIVFEKFEYEGHVFMVAVTNIPEICEFDICKLSESKVKILADRVFFREYLERHFSIDCSYDEFLYRYE